MKMMEDNKYEPAITISESSLRTSLVLLVIEHFVHFKQFEMLNTRLLEIELSHLLNSSLGFETNLEINHNPDIIAKGVFSGIIKFIDLPINGKQSDGFKVVQFNVTPSMMALE